MKVKIDIDTKTFIRFWLVVISFALVVFAVYSMRTALLIIGISAFLSIALSPIVNKLTKHLPKKNRVLGTAIAYLVVIAALGMIIFLVIPPITSQTVKFIQNVPDLMDSGKYGAVNEFVDKYGLKNEYSSIVDSIKTSTASWTADLGGLVINGIGSVLSAVTSTILILVLTFLMLVDGPGMINRIWKSYPDRKMMQSHQDVARKMYSVITRYVTGQLTVSSIAAVVSGSLVFILSVIFNSSSNLAIPSAAIIFILSMIPLFGEITGAVIISVFIAINNITMAIIFIALFIVYAQIEANMITPKVQSKRIELSPLIILVAVTIGIYLFGIIGGIVSIPIAGCVKVLIEYYIEQSKKSSTNNKNNKNLFNKKK